MHLDGRAHLLVFLAWLPEYVPVIAKGPFRRRRIARERCSGVWLYVGGPNPIPFGMTAATGITRNTGSTQLVLSPGDVGVFWMAVVVTL